MQTVNKDKSKFGEPKRQYAALPFRNGREMGEDIDVLLVSTRGSQRWVVPKGWPMKGKSPHATAAREALEEAGVVGEIAEESIGSYYYRKGREGGLVCLVEVFPLWVTRQRKNWLEMKQRVVKWFPLSLAAEAVYEPGLKAVIRNFERVHASWLAKPETGESC